MVLHLRFFSCFHVTSVSFILASKWYVKKAPEGNMMIRVFKIIWVIEVFCSEFYHNHNIISLFSNAFSYCCYVGSLSRSRLDGHRSRSEALLLYPVKIALFNCECHYLTTTPSLQRFLSSGAWKLLYGML